MALSIEDKVGAMLREHPSRTGTHRALAVAGWIAVGAAGAAGLLSVGRALFAYQNYGPLALERWAAPPALAAAAFLLAGGSLGLLARGRGRKVVRQHERGLLIVSGRRGSAIPWDEIRAIHTRSIRYGLGRKPWGRQGELVLVAGDGRRYHLEQSLSDYDDLAEAVKRAVYPPLLDAYTRAFNQGQPVPFGPLSLTAEGLRNGRKTLRWEHVGAATLERGWLSVVPVDRKLGPRLRFPARSIPNVDLCLQLVQELTPRR